MATVASDLSIKLVADLNEKFNCSPAMGVKGSLAYGDTELTIKPGTRYDRIVKNDQSVFAFVDKQTGGLLKAAGWKTPAKGVRYDLASPERYAQAVTDADPYSSFLYR